MVWEDIELKNKKAITFVAHIEKHISEMNIEGKVKCRICGKDIDEIFKEEVEGNRKHCGDCKFFNKKNLKNPDYNGRCALHGRRKNSNFFACWRFERSE